MSAFRRTCFHLCYPPAGGLWTIFFVDANSLPLGEPLPTCPPISGSVLICGQIFSFKFVDPPVGGHVRQLADSHFADNFSELPQIYRSCTSKHQRTIKINRSTIKLNQSCTIIIKVEQQTIVGQGNLTRVECKSFGGLIQNNRNQYKL
jgi:hypothetical protein